MKCTDEVPPIFRPEDTTQIPTFSPTYNPIISIDTSFIDDFGCDKLYGINGWSNCDQISSKYHGPFNGINFLNTNIMYRYFKCNELSSQAIISFSIIYDCNVAFVDEILFYINNILISKHNAASYKDIINDPLLMNISNCNWYIDKDVTYLMNLTDFDAFQLKFETSFKANVMKNIVITQINIDCVIPLFMIPTTTNILTQTPTLETYTNDMIDIIDRNEELKCNRYYTNSNSKTKIARLDTMNDNFISFSIQRTNIQQSVELRLSFFDDIESDRDKSKNNEEKLRDEWYWNVNFQFDKEQIIVQNKSTNSMVKSVFPSKFVIKDKDDCFLDITINDDIFWNCQSQIEYVTLWLYDNNLHSIYNIDTEKQLICQIDKNIGFGIDINYQRLELIQSFEGYYKISFEDLNRNYSNYSNQQCQLTKDDDDQVRVDFYFVSIIIMMRLIQT